jgi:dTMP kinase
MKGIGAIAKEFGIFRYIPTREPGGSRNAELIRNLLKEGKPVGMDDQFWTELEAGVFYTAGGLSLEEVIIPNLQAPFNVVISDRWRDSTWAYQWENGAGNCSTEYLEKLHRTHIGSFKPSLTLYIDISDETLVKRRNLAAQKSNQGGRDGLARYDDADLSFHQKIARGYEERMKMDPNRFVRIDGNGSLHTVLVKVWKQIIDRMWDLGKFTHGENRVSLLNAAFELNDAYDGLKISQELSSLDVGDP